MPNLRMRKEKWPNYKTAVNAFRLPKLPSLIRNWVAESNGVVTVDGSSKIPVSAHTQ